MAVVGFDNVAIAQYLDPPLTTVHVDAYALGQKAVQLMLGALKSDGDDACERHTLSAVLKVRRSCGSMPDRREASRDRSDIEASN